MYSSILVVGGGLMFHGAQEFLLHRIINKMPPSFRRLVDNVEVITRPKVNILVCVSALFNRSLEVTVEEGFVGVSPGYGPSADILERWGSAGMFRHHSGDVDSPRGVAALWCPNATRESCLCLVKSMSTVCVLT